MSPPAAGNWTVVGKLRTARSQHTATLLPDGRVLLVGGIGPDKPLGGGVTAGDVLGTVELYDPLLRIWRPGHSMSTPRLGHIAILLLDGRVLVAGGMDTAPVPGCDTSRCNLAMTSAELYDPTTNTWRRTGSMHGDRLVQWFMPGRSTVPLSSPTVAC
ncbi:MAG TPA: kelch repeat-containing protein [Candidatus Limnocylindrales bacterium]|nr:kelch repeat-containing protein [Candidatus Limnocylindrales bacterium]